MDININVTGLDSIAASINNLANAIGAQSLATGIEAAAAVAKVQSDSKKSTKKSQPAADTATDQATSTVSQASDSASASQETASDPKTNGQEESAASVDTPLNGSTTTEKAAQSEDLKDAPAPMSLDELRSVVAEASKRDIAKTQALVKEFGVAKISEVPEDKRAELAKLMAGV